MQLSKPQQEAIATTEGQVILISCPGSGKTSTVVRRVQYMVEHGIPAQQILVLTFSRAAASEMKERFLKLASKEKQGEEVWFATIHSFCFNVISAAYKLKADNIFKSEFNSIENESSIIAEFIPKNENSYTVKCKIVENNETIFEVKSFVGSRERAKKIVDNWNKNANEIYPEILNLLLKDSSNNNN